MNKKLLIVLVCFLPGCRLLTHKEVQEARKRDYLSSKEKQAQLSNDPGKNSGETITLLERGPDNKQAEGKQAEGKQAEGKQAEGKQAEGKQKNHLRFGDVDVLQKIAQIENSLRDLRGQISAQDKALKDRIAEVEQGLLALIQTLDLRMASLASEVKGKKKKNQKDNPEELFKMAEQFFKKGKWKLAIINYEKYRAQNKTGKFYEKATFQIGQCFRKLSLHKEAKVFFREVVESFPKSNTAKSAKKLLSAPSVK